MMRLMQPGEAARALYDWFDEASDRPRTAEGDFGKGADSRPQSLLRGGAKGYSRGGELYKGIAAGDV